MATYTDPPWLGPLPSWVTCLSLMWMAGCGDASDSAGPFALARFSREFAEWSTSTLELRTKGSASQSESRDLELVAARVPVAAVPALATFYDAAKGIIRTFEIDDEVRPGLALTAVTEAEVTLGSGADLRSFPRPPSEPVPIASEPVPIASEPVSIPEIRCDVGFTRCEIDQAYADTLRSNPTALSAQGRLVPADRDGKVVGYKLYGVRPGSIPKSLGLKNGDLLVAINGWRAQSRNEVLKDLLRESQFTISIERRGEPLQKIIVIK